MTFYERIENQGTQTLAVWMFIELLARMCNVLQRGSEVCKGYQLAIWRRRSTIVCEVYNLHSAFYPSLRFTLSLQSAFYYQSAFYPWSAVSSLQSAVRSLHFTLTDIIHLS